VRGCMVRHAPLRTRLQGYVNNLTPPLLHFHIFSFSLSYLSFLSLVLFFLFLIFFFYDLLQKKRKKKLYIYIYKMEEKDERVIPFFLYGSDLDTVCF
jgi:hypothetical protein